MNDSHHLKLAVSITCCNTGTSKATPKAAPAPAVKAPEPAGDTSEEDDNSDIDAEQLKADELAEAERKKAGLPEMDPDALPSSIATKMLPF